MLLVYWENDIFAGTDQYYTNAVRMTWLSGDLASYADDERLPQSVREWLASLPWLNREGFGYNVGLSIGQNMYTPTDITTPDLIEDERPYAGWLYGAVSLNRKSTRWLHAVEASAGMVGPASLAEPTQKFVHKVVDSPDPKGWDNQLDNELGLILTYLAVNRLWSVGGDGLGAAFMPHFGATAGNVMTYANAGAEARFGWNLPADFGSSRIRPGAGVTADVAPGESRPFFSLYLFATADGRAVARNIFLDGNTFESSHSVPKKNFVADLSAGVGLRLGDLFASFQAVHRTPEFFGQDEGQSFGSVNVGWTF